MSQVTLYFDEDSMQNALVAALRARHVDVITASECGMVNRSDEEHLERSRMEGRVLYSFNIRDYALIHERWMSAGRNHAGIVLASQQRYSTGEQMRRLLYLVHRRTSGDMLSRIEYLSAWGR